MLCQGEGSALSNDGRRGRWKIPCTLWLWLLGVYHKLGPISLFCLKVAYRKSARRCKGSLVWVCMNGLYRYLWRFMKKQEAENKKLKKGPGGKVCGCFPRTDGLWRLADLLNPQNWWTQNTQHPPGPHKAWCTCWHHQWAVSLGLHPGGWWMPNVDKNHRLIYTPMRKRAHWRDLPRAAQKLAVPLCDPPLPRTQLGWAPDCIFGRCLWRCARAGWKPSAANGSTSMAKEDSKAVVYMSPTK